MNTRETRSKAHASLLFHGLQPSTTGDQLLPLHVRSLRMKVRCCRDWCESWRDFLREGRRETWKFESLAFPCLSGVKVGGESWCESC